MIGVINNRKGLLVGTCIGVTHQEQMSNLKYDENEGQYVDVTTGELVEDRVNKFTPWYYIQFAFKQRNFFKNFNLGSGYNQKGGLDSNGANKWRKWWTDCYNLKGVYYHRNKCWQGKDQDSIRGKGFLRIDVVQANASFGLTRQECINIIATKGFGWDDPVNTGWFNSPGWTLEETYTLAETRIANNATTLTGERGDPLVEGSQDSKHTNAILILQGFNKNAEDSIGSANSKITLTELNGRKLISSNNPYGTTDTGEPTPYENYMDWYTS